MRKLTPKLGRNPKKIVPGHLKLATYLKPSLPAPPPHVNWIWGLTDFGLMLNDNEGDCTCACAGHMIEIWTHDDTGKEIIVPDSAVQAAYVAVTGQEGAAYDPATGANDNGCAISDVLAYWQQTGIGGHKLQAYLSVDPSNKDHVKQAIQLFGGLDIGVNLPLTAKNQVGGVWTVESATDDDVPGSWGGHCVNLCTFDQYGLTCITWGATQRMTWQWFFTYCDEAWALLSPDWFAAGEAPLGLDLAQLLIDLKQV